MISEMAPGSSPRFLYCFITENRKHPSSPECLVSVQKVMEGSELELAKVSSLAEPSLNTVGALFLGFEVSMSSHLAGAEANLNPRILGARATQQRGLLDHYCGAQRLAGIRAHLAVGIFFFSFSLPFLGAGLKGCLKPHN